MAKKLKILYYSDCTFFAGCENMIASFLNNEDLNNRYDVCFLYCLSEAYTAGLNARVAVEGKSIMSIKLPRPNRVHDYFKQKIANRKLRMIISAPIMWIWKYYCVFFSIYPLYKKLKPLQIDVLHINNGGYPAAVSCYAMVFVASILRIKKVVYVVNNIAEGYKNPLRWLDWGLDQWVKQKVTYFVTGSQFAKRALVNALSLNASKAVNIPNGVLPRDITLDPLTFKKEHNIPLNRVVFCTVALLETRKGHLFLLKSIVKLKENSFFQTHDFPIFVFEGTGSEQSSIEAFIRANNLANDVLMLGSIKNVYNLINASDVFILPSIANEDFPNVVLEAMLNKKPVIGTNIAGIPEQIANGKSGYVVEPHDIDQMGEAIIKLLNAYLRQEFSLNAQKIFEEKFTIEASMNSYVNLYET